MGPVQISWWTKQNKEADPLTSKREFLLPECLWFGTSVLFPKFCPETEILVLLGLQVCWHSDWTLHAIGSSGFPACWLKILRLLTSIIMWAIIPNNTFLFYICLCFPEVPWLTHHPISTCSISNLFFVQPAPSWVPLSPALASLSTDYFLHGLWRPNCPDYWNCLSVSLTLLGWPPSTATSSEEYKDQ